jgi:hypothetical protein
LSKTEEWNRQQEKRERSQEFTGQRVALL